MRFLVIASVVFVAACTSTPPVVDENKSVSAMSDAEYAALLQKKTVHDRKYEGFYQIFEASALLLNLEVQDILLTRQIHFNQWVPEKIRTEREKTNQLNATQTRVILSFFSPDFQYDDLAKTNSVWHLYLEVGTARYEAKVKKVSSKLVEVKTLYPFHNRFSTPYELTFMVPVAQVEQNPVSLTLTSTLGSSTMKFK